MTTYRLNELLSRVHARVREFAREHADETFYAFAIDAGMLCLNSEERFQETLESLKKNIGETRPTDLKPDDLTGEQHKTAERLITEGRFTYYVDTEDDYLEKKLETKEDFCEYLNQDNEKHNSKIERRLERYQDPDKLKELKRNTGDWAYQGFAELSAELSDAHDDPHYDLGDVEQETSDYAVAVKSLIGLLRRHQDQVFCDLKRTSDFELFAAGHEY
jgi:hypothetical protein